MASQPTGWTYQRGASVRRSGVTSPFSETSSGTFGVDGRAFRGSMWGSGYGEVMEAVDSLSPPGSRIEGLEPMHVKAEAARRRGLTVIEDYLHRSHDKVQVVSFIDVFSHIPDFRSFLEDVKAVLKPGGEIFMETGNLSDLTDRQEFPDELGVPDHLVFAGEAHLRGFLREAGFEVVRLERRRIDGCIHTAKGVVKRILGRPGQLRLPYTSEYRQLLVRARLEENQRPRAIILLWHRQCPHVREARPRGNSGN